MTEEQETQLRAIMEIEGFDQATINATIVNTRYHPKEAEKWAYWLPKWELVTETKQ